MLFWPCMFPLILGTLFYFAFGNISESDFETVQAAFVEENPGDSVFPSFLEEVMNHAEIRLFNHGCFQNAYVCFRTVGAVS